MKNVNDLLEECRHLGATLTVVDDRIRVKAPQPLPNEILNELRESKSQILAELRHQLKEEATCWLLEEWRRSSLPEWREILKNSIASGDKNREEYARWMLSEILDDTDYIEGEK